MDNPNRGTTQAHQQSSIDWYSFNQEKPAGRGTDHPHKPSPEKPGGNTHPDKHHPHLTLYDVAKSELKHSHKPIKNSDDVYHELNEMMVAHGHKKANLDGRTQINDHMLPKEWNYVNPRSLMEHHDKNGGKNNHPDKPQPAPENPGEPKHPQHPGEPKAPQHPGEPKAPQHPGDNRTPLPSEHPAQVHRPAVHHEAYRHPGSVQPQYGYDAGGQQFAGMIGNLIGSVGAGFLSRGLMGRGGYGGFGGYNGYGGFGGYHGYGGHPYMGGFGGYGGYRGYEGYGGYRGYEGYGGYPGNGGYNRGWGW